MTEQEEDGISSNNQTARAKTPTVAQNGIQNEENGTEYQIPDLGKLRLRCFIWSVICLTPQILKILCERIAFFKKIENYSIVKLVQIDDTVKEAVGYITGISITKSLVGDWYVRLPYIEMIYIAIFYLVSYFSTKPNDKRILRRILDLILLVFFFEFWNMMQIVNEGKKGFLSPIGLLSVSYNSLGVWWLAIIYSLFIICYPLVLDLKLKEKARSFSFYTRCLFFLVMNGLVFIVLYFLNHRRQKPEKDTLGFTLPNSLIASLFMCALTVFIYLPCLFTGFNLLRQLISRFSAVLTRGKARANTAQEKAHNPKQSTKEKQKYRTSKALKIE